MDYLRAKKFIVKWQESFTVHSETRINWQSVDAVCHGGIGRPLFITSFYRSVKHQLKALLSTADEIQAKSREKTARIEQQKRRNTWLHRSLHLLLPPLAQTEASRPSEVVYPRTGFYPRGPSPLTRHHRKRLA
ncbi:hypothetical protein EVAR_79929_1 [Eumeta japonica]|uniref:Uncharacterized protein n=1 Tax=Eumeta variegata TaxID=151549 RepID=A0A4C1TZ97_EUMVA|nr:hypothetical protein EVAR_79929_1 [Eumeta japonica]